MSTPRKPASRSTRATLGLAIACAVALAYANSLRGPFVFDDGPAILENPAVQRPSVARILGSGGGGGETTRGRPVVTLSLALNHALGGQRVAGYHITNVLIHAAAALVLFGVLRRTAARLLGAAPAAGREQIAAPPPWIAAAAAALWGLHPLQTQAVTYVVQRAESLMGLFYLVTLYGFLRAVEAARAGRWLGISVIACALGMATKEVMVSAPLAVLLYDRTFVAGSLREAWRRRQSYYLALLATWSILAALVWSTESRGGTAGFATSVTPWQYLLTQAEAIGRYLGLTLWPHPLVFDYGTAVVQSLDQVVLPATVLLALAAATCWALWRNRPVGVAGFWFWAILAPSSSFVPVASQTSAEHRMYLPLAALVFSGVFLLARRLGRRGLLACAVLAVAFATLTWRRNDDYRSAEALWADTVAKFPTNARAHHNLGRAALDANRLGEAVGHFQSALRLEPRAGETHYNLGLALARAGRFAEAIASYKQALALDPAHAEAHNNLGNALLATGQPAAARTHYEQALRAKPAFAEAHHNLGNLLLQLGEPAAALRHFAEALRLDPAYVEAHFNAGNACAERGRFPQARAHYEDALRLDPNHSLAHNNLANVLLELDRPGDAISHYQRALQLDPASDARRNLALLLVQLGRPGEALPHLEALSAARPHDREIGQALERARAALLR